MAQEEGLVLMEGFEQDDQPEDADLDYMMLFRTVALSDADACSAVRDTLSENDAEPTLVDTLAAEGESITRAERKVVKQLQPGDVSARASFVGFKHGHENARGLASAIITRSVTRPGWKFWG